MTLESRSFLELQVTVGDLKECGCGELYTLVRRSAAVKGG